MDAQCKLFIVDKQEGEDFALDDQIAHLLRRAHQRATAIFIDVLGEHNLTPTQFFALARLYEMGQLSQNRLGRLSAMDPATVQGVIHRLADRDLIQRLPDTTDRRRMVLRLTANGYTTIRDMLAEIAKVDEAIVDRLRPSERDVFVGLLRKLI